MKEIREYKIAVVAKMDVMQIHTVKASSLDRARIMAEVDMIADIMDDVSEYIKCESYEYDPEEARI